MNVSSSIDIMRSAHSWLTSFARGPIWIILSSYLWDLARRFTYFPDMLEEDWLREYKANFTSAAAWLSNLADRRVVLVGDYGCRADCHYIEYFKHLRHGVGYSRECDSSKNASRTWHERFCLSEPSSVMREMRAAEAVESVGRSLGLRVVNLERTFRGQMADVLLSERDGRREHPTSHACVRVWNSIWAALEPTSNATFEAAKPMT